MSGANETGGAGTPPEVTRPNNAGCIGCYHGPADPHKSIRFISDGLPIKAKGQRAAFLLALVAAENRGVAHLDCLPWMLNPADAVKALRERGVRIDTRKGSPSRWVLRSIVREVKP